MPELHEQLQAALGDSYVLGASPMPGGAGRDFVADETATRQRVVVKLVDATLARGVGGALFAKEIAKAVGLQHPNIIPVRGTGTLDSGMPYYTTTHVEGQTLRARLAEGPLALIDALTILRDIATALAFAHEHGVIHCNLNPDNIVLVGESAMVSDFGVASAITAARTIPHVPSLHDTTAKFSDLGPSFGTPAYMAPEQTLGESNLDARTDIYAFGCLAYELVADGPPFGSRASTQLMMAHVTKAPPSLESRGAEVPQALDALIMACLRKQPGDRPQSARALVTTLEQILRS